MNKHILIDRLVASVGRLLPDEKKFFSGDLHSPTFTELLEQLKVLSFPFPEEGAIREIETEMGEEKITAAIKLAQWEGKEAPTFIYHHGNNERPFDMRKGAKNTYPHIFLHKGKTKLNANLVVVRAPFHEYSLKDYQRKMRDLKGFMIMIAASVNVNEAIISKLRESTHGPVFTCGISLGGWVTNLHRAFYNNSDAYIPLLAGSFLGSLFTQSYYRHLTSGKAKENQSLLEAKLNFQDLFEKTTTPNLYPLLAQYDQFITLPTQSKNYAGYPLKTIEAGHITGALSGNKLGAHIQQVLNSKGRK